METPWGSMLQYRCSPVNIAKHFRTPALKNICELLILDQQWSPGERNASLKYAMIKKTFDSKKINFRKNHHCIRINLESFRIS